MWKICTCSILLYLFSYISSHTTDDLNSSVVSELTTIEYDFNTEDSLEPKECRKQINKTSGSFSLSMPTLDVKNDYCLWIIDPENDTNIISLFFHELFLHDDDSVTIYKSENDAVAGNNSIINPLSANNGSVTVVTKESHLVIKLMGKDKLYKRKFNVMFQSNVTQELEGSCSFDITSTDLYILYSPIHAEGVVTKLSCQYTYNNNNHNGAIPSFIFDQFNFNGSNEFILHDSSLNDGLYTNVPPVNFFPGTKNSMKFTVHMTIPTNQTYELRIHRVNIGCSGYEIVSGSKNPKHSVPNMLNNGSIINECLWIFKSESNKMLGIEFKDLHFEHALDIIAINDGASENSQPVLQVTTSNFNSTMSQPIRTTGQYIWIAFKPVTFASKISFEVSNHDNGGHFIGNGTIGIKSGVTEDTVFQLEADPNQVVFLNFTSSKISPPGKLTIYDGFDKSNVLATLHGEIWYPLLSKSSKMMIIATDFSSSNFDASFKGVSPGCLHMSSSTSGDYVLSGNCNASCLWVIPPEDHPGSVLLLDLQFVSLGPQDQIEIIQLDSAQTRIGVVSANTTHVPQLIIPANIGALVEVNRGPCQKEKADTILIGHSSYIPVCGKNLSLDSLAEFQLMSPLYPDTYPVFANCRWKLSAPKENLIHIAFNALKLAPNHCVKIFHSSDNKTDIFGGSELPDDLFLTGESVLEFDSSNCKTPKMSDTLRSSSGFLVNGTVANCGAVLSKTTKGEFSVPANKSLCIWKVSIPETDNSANVVNIISYTVIKKDSGGNYELFVYDGASVRETVIRNNSLDTDIWSRTSNLIFIYKRIDEKKPSSILSVKYSTISCNETMQCDNKICLHPDWRCNGINECGDFSDERNCASVPIPPENKIIGYSSLAFWLTVMILFATGIILGVTGPFCYQKYRNGQYRRFGDISIIE